MPPGVPLGEVLPPEVVASGDGVAPEEVLPALVAFGVVRLVDASPGDDDDVPLDEVPLGDDPEEDVPLAEVPPDDDPAGGNPPDEVPLDVVSPEVVPPPDVVPPALAAPETFPPPNE